MKEKYGHEINEIVHELNAITRELDSMSNDIAREFKGIGSSHCANGIRNLSERYRRVKRELDKI